MSPSRQGTNEQPERYLFQVSTARTLRDPMSQAKPSCGEQESEEEEGELQELTYDPPTLDDLNEEEEFDQLAIIKFFQPLKLYLGVVRCVIAQPVPANDRRRTAILTMNVLINDKPYKVLIDSGSCINAISRSTINRTGLAAVPHPKPYHVS